MFKRFTVIVFALFALAACEKDNNNDENNNENNNNNENGSYNAEVKGDTTLSLQGNALINPMSSDTALSIVLTPTSGSGSIGSGAIVIVADNAYTQQSLSVNNSSSSGNNFAVLTFNIGSNENIISLNGTFNVTEATQGDMIKGNFDIKALRATAQGDTLTVTGSFDARSTF